MNQFVNAEGVLFEVSVYDRSRDSFPEIIERPDWARIIDAIRSVFDGGGYVKLEVISPKQTFIKCLMMHALPGMYRLEVENRSLDHKEGIYEWWEPGDESFRGFMSFGDDEWDLRTVCSDVSVAIHAFSELYETGALENSLLSMRSWFDPKPWK